MPNIKGFYFFLKRHMHWLSKGTKIKSTGKLFATDNYSITFLVTSKFCLQLLLCLVIFKIVLVLKFWWFPVQIEV